VPAVVLEDTSPAGQRRAVGRGWRGTIAAHTPADVLDALGAVQRAADSGLAAAGFVCYEAASGLDPHLKVFSPPPPPAADLPLVWFALFDSLDFAPAELPPAPATPPAQWVPSLDAAAHATAVGRIREYIAAGDTYQVNYTMTMRAQGPLDAAALFARLCRAQRSPFSAFIDTGRHIICSASPELFFELDGRDVVTRPMKGTARRGLWYDDDRRAMLAFQQSAKDRAENAMIADMMRNDLGKIAVPGSIRVCEPFRVERYPTVWQMTTTVRCRTDADLPAIFKALFPCASVTGAPKDRTMEIIRELEASPRGVYTGAIGYVLPGRRARFSVAIRTAVIDGATGAATYGVGGGVVWDSRAQQEYDECLAKAAVLGADTPEFDLLETLLLEDGQYFLLDGHVRRLARSAEYFGFAFDPDGTLAALHRRAAELGRGRWRVRLLAGRDGCIHLEHAPAPPPAGRRTVRLASGPVSEHDPLLYHKTTHRRVYQQALADRPGADDVLLYNRRGEITETTIANVVAQIDGRLVTPPVECGLLEGVFREHLLASGHVSTAIIRMDDLPRATRLWAVNSLRKWVELQVLEG
jgi:para-aminobenzoate synthetase/4-amino-4-deoxychorismate lyase